MIDISLFFNQKCLWYIFEIIFCSSFIPIFFSWITEKPKWCPLFFYTPLISSIFIHFLIEETCKIYYRCFFVAFLNILLFLPETAKKSGVHQERQFIVPCCGAVCKEERVFRDPDRDSCDKTPINWYFRFLSITNINFTYLRLISNMLLLGKFKKYYQLSQARTGRSRSRLPTYLGT